MVHKQNEYMYLRKKEIIIINFSSNIITNPKVLTILFAYLREDT